MQGSLYKPVWHYLVDMLAVVIMVLGYKVINLVYDNTAVPGNIFSIKKISFFWMKDPLSWSGLHTMIGSGFILHQLFEILICTESVHHNLTPGAVSQNIIQVENISQKQTHGDEKCQGHGFSFLSSVFEY